MSKGEEHSVLTEREAKRQMSRGQPLICHRQQCEKLIQIDDAYVRKRCSNRGIFVMKYYHEECWDKMFI